MRSPDIHQPLEPACQQHLHACCGEADHPAAQLCSQGRSTNLVSLVQSDVFYFVYHPISEKNGVTEWPKLFANSSWIQRIALAVPNMNVNPGQEGGTWLVISSINYFDFLCDFWAIILAQFITW